MREIKIKVWDKRKKQMLPSSSIWKCDFRKYNTGDFTIILYTGLKDKTGKEIYEGDILDFNGSSYAGTPGRFNNVKGKFPVHFGDNKGFQMYEKGFGFYEIYSHEVEVIGNIHENSELLK